MVTVPGEFGSFGHDYRGDTTRFVRDAYHLPVEGEEMAMRIDDALKRIDVERKQRLAADTSDEPATWASEYGTRAIAGGVPLVTDRASGPRWFR
jgi:hypothetical protein